MTVDDRMVDHLAGHGVALYLAPEDGSLPEPDRHLDYAWEENDTWVFDRRDGCEAETFHFGSGLHPEPLVVPAWRVAQLHFEGGRLVCTAWMYGVDPRSRFDGTTHADPDGRIPLGICPIHAL
jgi:hypothetical protein